jgi:hypothetical protein
LFYFQFACNHPQRKYLFKTFPNMLVYCDPLSSFWGIGLAKTEKESLDPNQWKGQNQLGKLLVKIRNEMLLDPEMLFPEEPSNKRQLENDAKDAEDSECMDTPQEKIKVRKTDNPLVRQNAVAPLVRQNAVMRP